MFKCLSLGKKPLGKQFSRNEKHKRKILKCNWSWNLRNLISPVSLRLCMPGNLCLLDEKRQNEHSQEGWRVEVGRNSYITQPLCPALRCGLWLAVPILKQVTRVDCFCRFFVPELSWCPFFCVMWRKRNNNDSFAFWLQASGLSPHLRACDYHWPVQLSSLKLFCCHKSLNSGSYF